MKRRDFLAAGAASAFCTILAPVGWTSADVPATWPSIPNVYDGGVFVFTETLVIPPGVNISFSNCTLRWVGTQPFAVRCMEENGVWGTITLANVTLEWDGGLEV